MFDTIKVDNSAHSNTTIPSTLMDHDTTEVFLKATITRVKSHSNHKKVHPLTNSISIQIIAPISLACKATATPMKEAKTPMYSLVPSWKILLQAIRSRAPLAAPSMLHLKKIHRRSFPKHCSNFQSFLRVTMNIKASQYNKILQTIMHDTFSYTTS